MIPLRDENPTRQTAFVTIVVIAVCVYIYFGVQQGRRSEFLVSSPRDAACSQFDFNLGRAAIPYELTRGRPLTEREAEVLKRHFECPVDPAGPDSHPAKNIWLAVLFSMFMHGSVLHLVGNMLYLWVFGNNIEDTVGRGVYVAFYVAAGVAATVAHVLVDPSSPIPVVGASGAIAGVMGAYLVLFPRARILSSFGMLIFWTFYVRAWFLLGFWFVSQFFLNPNGGVAWMAHVGGFVFGVVAGLYWRATGKGQQRREYAEPAPYYY